MNFNNTYKKKYTIRWKNIVWIIYINKNVAIFFVLIAALLVYKYVYYVLDIMYYTEEQWFPYYIQHDIVLNK